MNGFEKQTMRQWLGDIEKVKAENKRLEELLTKGKDKRIEILLKENKQLRQDKELLLSDYEGLLEDKRELEKENKRLKKYYDRDKEELMESCYALKKENKELKAELEVEKEKSEIICIFVPYGVEPTFSEKEYPYKWEDEDGTYYSIMSKEEYLDYVEGEGE